MAASLDELKAYVGRRETATDVATASQIGRLAASIGVAHPAPDKGDPIPAGWHGAFFPPLAPPDRLREDGQPMGGGVAPPVPLPRRRLMGVRGTYRDPIRVGDEMTKVTEVAEVRVEDEPGGPAVYTTLRESISTPRGLAVVDERDSYFFGEGGGVPDPSPEDPGTPDWEQRFDPDPVTIFRATAVRFNSHRIHYDRDYTVEKEGFPGLVVPVTLTSFRMIELLRANVPDRPVASFAYRSARRIYDLGPISVRGRLDGDRAILWTTDQDGAAAVLGEARLGAAA